MITTWVWMASKTERHGNLKSDIWVKEKAKNLLKIECHESFFLF